MTRAPAGMDPKRTSGALRHGHRSFGARYVIQGFAIDEEHDLLFALGWPHLVLLLEDHPLDDDPVTSTIALWKQILSGRIPPEGAVDRRIWPRTVASNAVRILASPAGTFHSPTKLTWAPSAKGKKLLEKGCRRCERGSEPARDRTDQHVDGA